MTCKLKLFFIIARQNRKNSRRFSVHFGGSRVIILDQDWTVPPRRVLPLLVAGQQLGISNNSLIRTPESYTSIKFFAKGLITLSLFGRRPTRRLDIRGSGLAIVSKILRLRLPEILLQVLPDEL